ncbi:protoporphyrinogen/coproporphyrinogen oxidase [Oerskovia enterophila]|uniref:protoporphyrinogen/coproporphyrinogen oxidase n=1 Tax=Oerskovia enterophila TaxID=43678 RepID=UPI003815EBAB
MHPVADGSSGPSSSTFDAVVVGAGIAGLTAARSLRRRGLRVLVLEAADRPGGPVHGDKLGSTGLSVDVGAESFAARGSAVGDLVADLGLTVVEPAPISAWGYAASRAFPLPKAGIMGIPAHPFAADVRRAVGWPGALRAGMDRIKPRRWVDEENLETFARSRLGRRVAERLVAPVAAGVHSAPLERLDVDAVAPGLREAYAREGSLTRAVAAMRAQAPAGSAVRGIEGGMHRLVEELTLAVTSDVPDGGAPAGSAGPAGVLLVRHEVVALDRDGDLGWSVQAEGPGGPTTFRAPRLLVTTPAVVDLVSPLAGRTADPVPDPEPGADIRLVTLLLEAPELDAAPRGSGLLVAPKPRTWSTRDENHRAGAHDPVQAKALTHSTAKWPWLAARVAGAVGPGNHVVRLSYGRIGETVEPTLDQVVRDASVLLGVDLDGKVREHLSTRWNGSLPPPTPVYRREVAAFVERVSHVDGLGVTGGWIAGTGLAAIVGHAQDCAEQL